MIKKPTPHFDKLKAILENDKLPQSDRQKIELASKKYGSWIEELRKINGPEDQIAQKMVGLLNNYKQFIDIDIIFDSENDFLYRQKGQLKLDNSIIEEFLPWLIEATVLYKLGDDLNLGPTNCYSAISFDASIKEHKPGAGISVRTKDQDFAISRKLYIQASHDSDFKNSAKVDTYIAFVAAEIKTNLDKTMFQEACATARDLKIAVPSSRYFLLCEWLDMTPVSTVSTDIEEVLILRGKRLNSNIRKDFSSSQKRKEFRARYAEYLAGNPYRADVFKRFTEHVQALLTNDDPIEEDTLKKGYF